MLYRFQHNVHYTGHVKRLNRFKNNEIITFNVINYSKEEFCTEIGATFLNNYTGILNNDTLSDSSSYIHGWLNKLRNDKKLIIEVASLAQKRWAIFQTLLNLSTTDKRIDLYLFTSYFNIQSQLVY